MKKEKTYIPASPLSFYWLAGWYGWIGWIAAWLALYDCLSSGSNGSQAP